MIAVNGREVARHGDVKACRAGVAAMGESTEAVEWFMVHQAVGKVLIKGQKWIIPAWSQLALLLSKALSTNSLPR